MRRILVLNAGSGSQKCSLFELPDAGLPVEPLEPIWESSFDSTAPGQPEGKIVLRVRRGDEEMKPAPWPKRVALRSGTSDYSNCSGISGQKPSPGHPRSISSGIAWSTVGPNSEPPCA